VFNIGAKRPAKAKTKTELITSIQILFALSAISPTPLGTINTRKRAEKAQMQNGKHSLSRSDSDRLPSSGTLSRTMLEVELLLGISPVLCAFGAAYIVG